MSKTLVIDRKRWIRGDDDDFTYLLRSTDEKMCCLGFLALSEGVSKHDIEDAGLPSDILEHLRDELPEESGFYKVATDFDAVDENGDLENLLVTTNDDERLTEHERESRLISYFKKYLDIDVVFEG